MSPIASVVLVRADAQDALYVDGALVREGSPITAVTALRALMGRVYAFETVRVDDDWLADDEDGQFPTLLADIPQSALV